MWSRWFRRFIGWVFVVTGPHQMIRCRDQYFFLDVYGSIWRLRYTGHPDRPFDVELFERW